MIWVTPDVLAKIAGTYDAALPHEACGFLLGHAEGLDTHVTDFALPAGAAGSLNAFELSDEEIFRIAAYASDRDLSILMVFHSHPSGYAQLSHADLTAIKFSEWPWLLVTRTRNGALDLQAFAAGTADPIDVCCSTRCEVALQHRFVPLQRPRVGL